MAVSGIDDDGIDICLDERLDAVECIGCHTYAGSHAQTSLVVLAGHWFVLRFRDVLVGNQADEFVVIVEDGQLLYLVLLQNLSGCTEVGLDVSGYKVLACHHLIDGAVDVLLETEVTISDDALEVAFIIDDGDASDVILGHQLECIPNAAAQLDGDGIVDHTILGTLHDGYLTSLFVDAHVLMNHADATFAGNGNGHRSLCDRIHSGSHKRNLQLDVP